jgi:hypothetical protein
MDWQGAINAHNATTTVYNSLAQSSNLNSLDNVNLGGNVSIGLNKAPSAPFVIKNYSPPVVNGVPFYGNKNIFS